MNIQCRYTSKGLLLGEYVLNKGILGSRTPSGI
jgi:hypothetical protein